MHIQIQLFRSVRIYFEYFHSVISRVCDAESLDTKGPPAEIAFPLHQTISVLQDQSSASFPPPVKYSLCFPKPFYPSDFPVTLCCLLKIQQS